MSKNPWICAGMQIHRQHAVGAGLGDQVGDQLGADRRARCGLPILPRIAEIRDHRGDAARRRPAQRVQRDQQLHQLVVRRDRRWTGSRTRPRRARSPGSRRTPPCRRSGGSRRWSAAASGSRRPPRRAGGCCCRRRSSCCASALLGHRTGWPMPERAPSSNGPDGCPRIAADLSTTDCLIWRVARLPPQHVVHAAGGLGGDLRRDVTPVVVQRSERHLVELHHACPARRPWGL